MPTRPLAIPSSAQTQAFRPGGGLAVFDLDRTLLAGSSMLAFGRALAAAGLVTRRRLAAAALQDRRFRRRGAGDVEVARLRADALRHVADLERASLVDLAGEVGRRLCDDVYPGALSLLRRHHAAGDFVVLLSASPQELVEAVATGVGAHRAVGTRAAVADGRFTGALEGPFCYGAGKVERLAAELGSGVLASAVAYADSISDLPLLAQAAEPVAVNPDRRLAEEATRRGWPVLRFA